MMQQFPTIYDDAPSGDAQGAETATTLIYMGFHSLSILYFGTTAGADIGDNCR